MIRIWHLPCKMMKLWVGRDLVIIIMLVRISSPDLNKLALNVTLPQTEHILLSLYALPLNNCRRIYIEPVPVSPLLLLPSNDLKVLVH